MSSPHKKAKLSVQDSDALADIVEAQVRKAVEECEVIDGRTDSELNHIDQILYTSSIVSLDSSYPSLS
jgi:hypothetical protein